MQKKIYLLIGMFIACILFILVVSWLGLNKVTSLSDELRSRGDDSVQITDASYIGAELYQIIADSVINNHLAESKKDWQQAKLDTAKRWQTIERIVDTDEEQRLVSSAKQAYADFVTIYEQDMLPLLQVPERNAAAITDVDDKLDAKVEALAEDLKKLKVSLDGESAKVQENVKSVSNKSISVLLIVGLSVLLAAILAGWGLVRNIMRQLGGEPAIVAEVVAKIASGKLDNVITVAQGDTQSLLANTKNMQQQLLERITANQQLLDQSIRLKLALDNISVNVMLADNDRNIIYMNPAVHNMMQVAEADIRKSLPQFDARKLMGASIDSFHKNPAHQKELLARLNSTHKTEISIAGRTFALTANPITSPDGQKLGTVVEWLDRSADVKLEQDVAGAVSAAVLGDFSQKITEQGRQGFSLLLAQSINQLLATSETSLADLVNVLDALSTGDLTKNIDKDYAGTYGQLKDSANTTVANLRQLIGEIKNSTDTINTAAKEIASGNNDLSHRTEQQAASLEQTAASMEELTSTVQHNAENAKQANQYAMGASEIAGKGVAVVNQVVNTMSEINNSSHRIGDIISVIDDIAFQTNILALNAAVEAARAGEQGKGFAVVAIEVRNLAQRAAGAAGEIKRLIDDSVEKVSGGSKLVADAGKTMEEIVGAIQRVTGIVSEITSASFEQSSGISQVNQAIGQMDDVTQQNAALVEQAAAAAESLEEQAQQLAVMLGSFKVDGVSRAGYSASVRRTTTTAGSGPKVQTYQSKTSATGKAAPVSKAVSAE
ncbi:MAG: methyl-accepting chemotaxis protein, partial [Methylococcales bacterium]